MSTTSLAHDRDAEHAAKKAKHEGQVRVRSAEGEEVAWSRSAAARSAALANWVSDTGGAEGAFATVVPAAALCTLSRVAEGGAEEGRALEGSSLAQLAQLLHAAHFLDVDVELRRLLSRSLCTGHLAGKSGPELGRLLGVASDFPTEAERRAATEEPLYEQDAQHDATAPGAASSNLKIGNVVIELPPSAKVTYGEGGRAELHLNAFTGSLIVLPPAASMSVKRASDAPAPPACWLSTQLVNEDALEDALADADVPTMRALKGVSLAWRSRARRVLCARLCARLGLPLASNLDKVTELDLSGSHAAGRLLADAADARNWLFNLAKVTGLSGFEVDVDALRGVFRRSEYYPTEEVRECIRGEGEAPMEVLLAACALRDGEAHVPMYAFRSETSMTTIALPTGLIGIGKGAFYDCSSMTSITLPAGLTSIGAKAFYGCTSLTSIELPAGLTCIGDSTFSYCYSMKSITLPASLTSIGADAFQGCTKLTSIELPIGLTSIGACAFRGCLALTSIELPTSLTSIGDNAFCGCHLDLDLDAWRARTGGAL